MGNQLPIARLAKALVQSFTGVPDREEARCWNYKTCHQIVPAHAGIRRSGLVYCSEACVDEHVSHVDANLM
jgi:hypothetical protein